ncbi:TetR/AcrR family transcriptional regulator [Pseudonocardia spinosispora]|uniref:TetR/AcrR family transcriptional regulator n=1 Tax=Pseudonocardia spinosispora TaxID=103441 RepID=UPI00041FFECB
MAQTQLLDAAEELFYGRGIQSVGMDDIRSASGLSLKRVYQLFPAKDQLVVAYLDRRDIRWRGRLTDHVLASGTDPRQRILAVFDWLGQWFAEPDFRGCAWINCYGELGAVSEQVAELARTHKSAFRGYLGTLVADAGLPEDTAEHLYLLAEGAMVTAGIFGTPASADHARTAAAALLSAHP